MQSGCTSRGLRQRQRLHRRLWSTRGPHRSDLRDTPNGQRGNPWQVRRPRSRSPKACHWWRWCRRRTGNRTPGIRTDAQAEPDPACSPWNPRVLGPCAGRHYQRPPEPGSVRRHRLTIRLLRRTPSVTQRGSAGRHSPRMNWAEPGQDIDHRSACADPGARRVPSSRDTDCPQRTATRRRTHARPIRRCD